MALTIISLIKQVPLPTEMRMGDDGLMDRTKAKSIINIDCQFGLEAGLQLKKQYPDAKMIVCSMGPPSFEVALRTSRANAACGHRAWGGPAVAWDRQRQPRRRRRCFCTLK